MKFQKILSYNVYGDDQTSRFDYVCSLLNQTIDPISAEPQKLNARNKKVFLSPRKRALTCLNQETAITITVEPALNEIPFDLQKECTVNDFKILGSLAVRKTFIRLFLTNQLNLNHKTLKTEFDYLINLAQTNPTALALSHTFRLCLLRTYLKTNRQLFNDPSLIQKHLDPKEHWADFGSFIYFS